MQVLTPRVPAPRTALAVNARSILKTAMVVRVVLAVQWATPVVLRDHLSLHLVEDEDPLLTCEVARLLVCMAAVAVVPHLAVEDQLVVGVVATDLLVLTRTWLCQKGLPVSQSIPAPLRTTSSILIPTIEAPLELTEGHLWVVLPLVPVLDRWLLRGHHRKIVGHCLDRIHTVTLTRLRVEATRMLTSMGMTSLRLVLGS